MDRFHHLPEVRMSLLLIKKLLPCFPPPAYIISLRVIFLCLILQSLMIACSLPVTVTDSFTHRLSNGMNVDTASSMVGDEIILSPVKASDSVFVMLAQTKILYNCTPYLTAYGAGGAFSSSLLFDFRSVEVVEGTGDCSGAKNPAIAYIFFNPAANGTYNFSARFNQIYILWIRNS